MSINSEELAEFIKSTIKGIKGGIEGEDFLIVEPIRFNVAVAKIKEGRGGFKIYVVDAGGKYKAEEITRISFEINPNTAGDGRIAPLFSHVVK